MKRQVSLNEISDGRLYRRHDMVKAGCGGCRGCSLCCHKMGESAVLDPMDAHRLEQGLKKPFSSLVENKIELHVEEGVILPNLRMAGKEEACGFLDEEGRCSIHPYRPGVCRLFPLGRFYGEDGVEEDDGTFQYFLQVDECPAPRKTKVRVEKWIDLPDFGRYEQAVASWHRFLLDTQKRVAQEEDDSAVKDINLYLLEWFYFKPYDSGQDFYTQFAGRLKNARTVLDEEEESCSF